MRKERANKGHRGYAAIGLVNPKTNSNVGSVLRASHVYDAKMVAVTGRRYTRAASDTTAAYRHRPFLQVDKLKDVVPYDCVPVAVEILDGATPLPDYYHPERAFYVFGPEDGTLGKDVLKWCRDVVYVPGEECMNLAACVNVVLYDRMAKRRKA